MTREFFQRATSATSNERILQRVTSDFTTSDFLTCSKWISTSNEQRVKSYASKKRTLFLWRAPTLRSFTFNWQFLYRLKDMVHLSKTVTGIFHARFPFAFIKVYDSLTLKRRNSFQNRNIRKATHSFGNRPLIFKFQQENWKIQNCWKFNDICVSCSSSKTDWEFLNLENRSFEYAKVLRKYLWFLYLLTCLFL